MLVELTDKEREVLRQLKERDNELPSKHLKAIFGTEGRRPALTKANLPNIRPRLRSFMTAYHKAMCRGGYAWVSVVEWADGPASLEQFIEANSI